MIFLEYYRFVIDPQTEIEIKTGSLNLKSVKYHEEFDHTQSLLDSQTTIKKVEDSIHAWSNDHYGFVKLYITNSDEDTKPIKRKFCNHRRFWKDMLQLGILVTKQQNEEL